MVGYGIDDNQTQKIRIILRFNKIIERKNNVALEVELSIFGFVSNGTSLNLILYSRFRCFDT